MWGIKRITDDRVNITSRCHRCIYTAQYTVAGEMIKYTNSDCVAY